MGRLTVDDIPSGAGGNGNSLVRATLAEHWEIRLAREIGDALAVPLHRLNAWPDSWWKFVCGLPLFVATVFAIAVVTVTVFPAFYGVRRIRRLGGWL